MEGTYGRDQETTQTREERQGRTGAEGGADRLRSRTRRRGPAAPPLHTSRQARRQEQAPCAGGPHRGRGLIRSAPRMTVVSLGGGVQSTVMALMAGESLSPTRSGGAFGRVPNCAIFADTGWEPPTIYAHLEWLADKLRFPLHVVDNGRSLREDAKALVNHSGNAQIPHLRLLGWLLWAYSRCGVSTGVLIGLCAASLRGLATVSHQLWSLSG